ncbi:S-layer homology domain-containing protein [Flavonifractor sp. AGMB03687]|uniref:S-layer homology domain-containing protein n=1 Tax=Flavonifractor sp. AGMB03687 TaxID=2785133 RepID=UPI001AE02481
MIVKNLIVETNDQIKHGVQFYCCSGGKLSGVTVRGGTYTSVMINGANVTLENCDLHPAASAYANIEYAMGGGVTEIPEITLSNVTGNSGKPLVYADKATAIALNAEDDHISEDATQEQIAAAINEKYLHGAEITLYYAPDGGSGEGTVIPGTQTYTITFDVNGGNALAETTATTNNEGKLTELPTPTKAGEYIFTGWYTAAEGGMQVTGQYVFTANSTIYAHWNYTGGGSSTGGTTEPSGDYLVNVDRTTGGRVTVNPGRADKGDTVTITVKPDKGYELDSLIVTAKDGGAVKLTEKSANKFTFKMPGSKVTVEAVFVKEETKPVVTLPFADVNKGDWYHDAVEYVYENDLMNGTSATTFSPFVTTSRAMILTILARYDGVDTSTGSTWYEAGAVWAIAEGVSDGTNLEANLTREQLVTMLWRYAGSPVVESDLSGYPDSASVSDWAVNAMIWAVESGVITGNGAGALNPQGTATRAEVATILMRFIEK